MTNEELVKKIKELLKTGCRSQFSAVAKEEGSGEAGGLYQGKGRSGGR